MPILGAFSSARQACSVHFSQAGIQSAALSELRRPLAAARGCRTIGERDAVLNDALPTMTVRPETYEVRGGGHLPTSEPADPLQLAQRYFLP